jgi:isoleucyl-tRNA synthetase
MAQFAPVDLSAPLSKAEEEVIALWEKIGAFERQVEQREPSAENHYVFYDGPPFATGLPHYGHLVASTLKDVVPRYWAMRGKRVERRFGWDTHGLPIEMETEKALDLNGPSSIREFGVDKFNEACRSGVLRYTEEWRRTITRLGRWVDFDNDYKTMDLTFMESVWWVFKQLWDKGLVYQGVRVMPYSWRLSTALSNFEANLDYRDVDDPAVTVRLKIDQQPGDGELPKEQRGERHLLVWTTTPWTLPSNLGVAVGTDLDYVWAKRGPDTKASFGYLEDDDNLYCVAKARLEAVLGKDAIVVEEVKGKDLVGLSYTPLFDFFIEQKTMDGAKPAKGSSFIVMGSEHVTTEDGTGLVHMAPAYGEDDFNACAEVGIAPIDPVDEEGRFTAPVTPWIGVNVKEADKDIIAALKDKELLYKNERIHHSYPFCWRSGTPLIYKTFPVWFVKVEGLRDRMVAHNETIHWVPDAVGNKRFGNWLSEARDWAISRNRFWGTPLPIWECDGCRHHVCVGSVEELKDLVGETADDLHPHKIDHHTASCPSCDGGTLKRISEVFDCWFESGAMPYAQVHYPFENKETFEGNFPAQFIAEGLDQTRGWFYTLLVLSTALFDKAPFANCVVNGMVLAEDGAKMSKSKKNYPDPQKVLDEHGADALRAYLINSPVVRAEPLRFSDKGVREVVRSVILPLKSAWSFFVQYANADGWEPKEGMARAPALADRPELDRWILSVLQSLVREVNVQMEGYYLYKVIPPLLGFIDDLTNWYIRLCRRRFWSSASTPEEKADKDAAYATLYEVLSTFCTLMAPVLPFITESMYQGLVKEAGADDAQDSVHLCDYPRQDESKIDAPLEQGMAAVRQVVGMGRTLRERHKIKTRQPLKSMVVVSHNADVREALDHFRPLIEAELNLKGIELRSDETGVCQVSLKANFKKLGKTLGKKMKPVAAAIGQLSSEDLGTLQAGETLTIEGETIGLDDVLVSYDALEEGHQIEAVGDVTVSLDTQLNDELITEGLMREVVSKVQKLRKDAGLEITDRIALTWSSDDDAIKAVFATFGDRIGEETLATSVSEGDASSGEQLKVEQHALALAVVKAG